MKKARSVFAERLRRDKEGVGGQGTDGGAAAPPYHRTPYSDSILSFCPKPLLATFTTFHVVSLGASVALWQVPKIPKPAQGWPSLPKPAQGPPPGEGGRGPRTSQQHTRVQCPYHLFFVSGRVPSVAFCSRNLRSSAVQPKSRPPRPLGRVRLRFFKTF
jgi:hypothetical protein